MSEDHLVPPPPHNTPGMPVYPGQEQETMLSSENKPNAYPSIYIDTPPQPVKLATQKAIKTRHRSRSTVDFSYFDLDNCVEIAQAVATFGSYQADWTQVAKHIGMDPESGGFRIRMLSAKTFGLLTYGQGQVLLTELGKGLVNPSMEKRARVQAFVTVSLFGRLFVALRDEALPATSTVDQLIEDLGVAPKQREKARQVFYRSAKQAGVLNATEDRLGLPEGMEDIALPQPGDFPAKKSARKTRGSAKRSAMAKLTTGTPGLRRSPGRPSGTSSTSVALVGNQNALPETFPPNHATAHPFIRGLLEKLPKPETQWTLDDRSKWLTTAASIFDLMYNSKAQDTGAGSYNPRQYIWVEVKNH